VLGIAGGWGLCTVGTVSGECVGRRGSVETCWGRLRRGL
jgi:hypothetical protein